MFLLTPRAPSMASLPLWLEGILNRKYPAWRSVPYHEDGSAGMMPAGARLLEASLLRDWAAGGTLTGGHDRGDSGRVHIRTV